MNRIPEVTDDANTAKEALLAVDEALRRLKAAGRAKREPIAVIGLGCRLPGGAEDPEAFWRLLEEGRDAVAEAPPDRWDVKALYDPNPDAPGKLSCPMGAFLRQVDQFDATFFGISPREAIRLDPQQRLLLETAWEALENAAQSPDALVGSLTGVFVGVCSSDYLQLLSAQGRQQIDAYGATGNAHSVVAGRLSYLLGLRGPSLAVDTACSSSLVAVHLACQSLRNGECHLALAGGVNLMLAPETSIHFSKMRMLAPDGRCKTFDAAADGFGRGEGCGVVVLKRLSDAEAHGDRILALIRGSAINHDGRSCGLTVPNGPSQQDVIQQALKRAGVKPCQVGYVEAHGTGTALGDPIEIGALGAVFSEDRPKDQPLRVGSVKTNIGHLEGAAGIAGLIKVVLALQHEAIPPHLHFQDPNPHIDWASIPVVVPTQRVAWPAGSEERFAGVSSFGFSGTNAHVVLHEPPGAMGVEPQPARGLDLLALSAKTDDALSELAGRYCRHLADHPEQSLADLCFTANTGRSHFRFRLAVRAGSIAEMGQKLKLASQGRPAPDMVRGELPDNDEPRIAFLCAGPENFGARTKHELLENQPIFRQAIERCEAILGSRLEPPLRPILDPEDSRAPALESTPYAAFELFAVEYALAQVWKSWGVKPAVLLGWGVGEYVAACLAGVFALEDALKLLAAEVRRADGPAGDGQAAEAYRQAAHAVSYAAPHVDLLSILTAEVLGAAAATPEFWRRRTPSPAPSAAAILAIARRWSDAVVEISPDTACWPRMLETLAKLYVGGVRVDWPGIHTGQSCRKLVLPSYPFQRQRFWLEPATPRPAQPVSDASDSSDRSDPTPRAAQPVSDASDSSDGPDPTSCAAQPAAPVAAAGPEHPLLGRRLVIAGREIVFQSQLSDRRPAMLADHQVFRVSVLPTSGLLEMALAAAHGAFPEKELAAVEQLAIVEPLRLSGEPARTVQTVLAPEGPKSFSLRVLSLADAGAGEPAWILHASAKLAVGPQETRPARVDLAALKTECSAEVPVEDLYRQFERLGIAYGRGFRGIERLWQGSGEALGQIRLPDLHRDLADYHLHPALLDAGFQCLGGALPESARSSTWLPVGLERLRVYRRAESRLWSRVRIRRETDADPASVILDVQLLDPNGEVIAAVDGFTLRQISAGRGVTVEGAEDAPQADAAPAACHRQPALLEQLAGASEEERRQRLVDYARQQIARVLGLDAVQVDLRQPLNSLGLDSLMAFELKSRLDMELGLDVPMVAFLDGSDVPGLAAMLSRQLGAVASSGTGGDGADRGADWIEGEL